MSDVPEGYKQTEVGVIPEDWEVRKLEEVGEALIGLTYSPNDVASEGILVLRSSNIQSGMLAFEDNVYVKSEVPERLMVKPGDILICVRNGSRDLIGKSTILDSRVKGMTFGAFMSVFRSPYSQYLAHFFKSHIFLAQVEQHLGATINQITNASIYSFVVPFPPTPEQKAIAEVLADTDALIAAQERLIAKKQAIKQGAMQELLTGHKRLEGFEGEWEEVRLGDVAEMASGGTPDTKNPAFYGGEIQWVSIADMSRTGKFLRYTEKTLSGLGYETSAARLFKPPVLLFAMYASIGKVCIATQEVSSSQAILGIDCGTRLDIEYLYYYLSFNEDSLKGLGQQGTQANLNKGIVQDLFIPLPDFPEQQAIASILSDMDAEIEALDQQLSKTRALKQGMMQELLTGRTRLI
ncbi:restriction endonuclease subunit S [Deinococcus sp. Marseille-Q6407]|uniref:restriction endonuclease subunit S n=1 Tax=Deinococcus sp. Marseille-Q6407 TaxID=2969223 RepID=UPI0021C1D353|nr:restriction endonuclease subunit S [Deinococcus sp. Marseille-Q6407]